MKIADMTLPGSGLALIGIYTFTVAGDAAIAGWLCAVAFDLARATFDTAEGLSAMD